LASNNKLAIIIILILLYCVFAYRRFKFRLVGAADISFEITEIECANHEHLIFLATYIVPFAGFNINNNRQLAALVLLLVVIGIIFIKTNIFYTNPTLTLLGFQTYRASGLFKNGERRNIILICQEKLKDLYIMILEIYTRIHEKYFYCDGW